MHFQSITCLKAGDCLYLKMKFSLTVLSRVPSMLLLNMLKTVFLCDYMFSPGITYDNKIIYQSVELASTKLYIDFALKIPSWALIRWTILREAFLISITVPWALSFLLKWYMKYFNIMHIPGIIKFIIIKQGI